MPLIQVKRATIILQVMRFCQTIDLVPRFCKTIETVPKQLRQAKRVSTDFLPVYHPEIVENRQISPKSLASMSTARFKITEIRFNGFSGVSWHKRPLKLLKRVSWILQLAVTVRSFVQSSIHYILYIDM
jgi:hypothetical protein